MENLVFLLHIPTSSRIDSYVISWLLVSFFYFLCTYSIFLFIFWYLNKLSNNLRNELWSAYYYLIIILMYAKLWVKDREREREKYIYWKKINYAVVIKKKKKTLIVYEWLHSISNESLHKPELNFFCSKL